MLLIPGRPNVRLAGVDRGEGGTTCRKVDGNRCWAACRLTAACRKAWADRSWLPLGRLVTDWLLLLDDGRLLCDVIPDGWLVWYMYMPFGTLC